MRWADHVARMGELRNSYKTFGQKTRREESHSEELGVDGKVISERILEE